MIARTEACSILDFAELNEEDLLLVGSNSVTFFGKTIALRDDAVIDCLIKWAQYSPEPPCLRAWTQLTYFLSFSTSSVFPLHFSMSKIFISPSVQNVKNVRVTLVFIGRAVFENFQVSFSRSTFSFWQISCLIQWKNNKSWKISFFDTIRNSKEEENLI